MKSKNVHINCQLLYSVEEIANYPAHTLVGVDLSPIDYRATAVSPPDLTPEKTSAIYEQGFDFCVDVVEDAIFCKRFTVRNLGMIFGLTFPQKRDKRQVLFHTGDPSVSESLFHLFISGDLQEVQKLTVIPDRSKETFRLLTYQFFGVVTPLRKVPLELYSKTC